MGLLADRLSGTDALQIMTWVEVTYLVSTCLSGDSYHLQFRSLLLCPCSYTRYICRKLLATYLCP